MNTRNGYVKGFAFEPDWRETADERKARYRKIASHRNLIESISPEYGKTVYTMRGSKIQEFSDLDLALICDQGNTCFGAVVYRVGDDYAKVTIYID